MCSLFRWFLTYFQDSVSSASPTKQDRSNSMHLVGRCYDLTGGGSIKGTQVFKEETLSSGAIITRGAFFIITPFVGRSVW